MPCGSQRKGETGHAADLPRFADSVVVVTLLLRHLVPPDGGHRSLVATKGMAPQRQETIPPLPRRPGPRGRARLFHEKRPARVHAEPAPEPQSLYLQPQYTLQSRSCQANTATLCSSTQRAPRTQRTAVKRSKGIRRRREGVGGVEQRPAQAGACRASCCEKRGYLCALCDLCVEIAL